MRTWRAWRAWRATAGRPLASRRGWTALTRRLSAGCRRRPASGCGRAGRWRSADSSTATSSRRCWSPTVARVTGCWSIRTCSAALACGSGTPSRSRSSPRRNGRSPTFRGTSPPPSRRRHRRFGTCGETSRRWPVGSGFAGSMRPRGRRRGSGGSRWRLRRCRAASGARAVSTCPPARNLRWRRTAGFATRPLSDGRCQATVMTWTPTVS